MRDIEFKGAAELPYNPKDYGLPVWRDEEHEPSQENTESQETDNMTADTAKNKLCAWAMAQVGYREGANNWQKYAENTDLQAMYGWKPQNQPWCDVFVDSGFIECFGLDAACKMTYQPIGSGSALCRTSADYYKEHGAFYHTPEIGDQVFFYASGDINHTGIVVRVDGGSVHTMEGNSSDMVAERVYSVSDSKIAGYGRPNWALVEDPAVGATGTETVDSDAVKPKPADFGSNYELRLPYLSKGDKGYAVWVVQTILQANGISCGQYGADKDFGSDTELAVRQFQRKHGLQADGIVGPDTGAALFGGEVYTPEIIEEEPKADSFWNNLLTKIRKS